MFEGIYMSLVEHVCVYAYACVCVCVCVCVCERECGFWGIVGMMCLGVV